MYVHNSGNWKSVFKSWLISWTIIRRDSKKRLGFWITDLFQESQDIDYTELRRIIFMFDVLKNRTKNRILTTEKT